MAQTVGLAFGGFGLLVNIRTTISLILDDHDNYTKFGEDLVPLLSKVSKLTADIEHWSSSWKIHDGCSKDLLTTYWGARGGLRIWAFRTSIGLACRRIQKEFKSMYGKVACRTEARLREDGTAEDSAQVSSVASEKRINRQIQHYKKRVGAFKRLTFSITRRPLFHKHLDALASDVKTLRKIATTEFAYHWNCDVSEVQKLAVDVWTHFILSNLATTVKTSEALLELLSTVTTLDVDYQFDLGYGIPTNQRADVLAERAARGAFPYCLEVYRRSTESAIKVTAEAITPDEHREWYSSFERGILSWTGPAQDDILYMKPENREGAFTVKRRQGWHHRLQALRSLFPSMKPEDLKHSLHGEFTMRDRIKLAYELAESVMVFLKTNWYCCLCSCRIQRVCIDEVKEEYEYCLRMSDTRHLDPQSGEMQTRKQWCEEELLNMHIQRLGILLVEIALGIGVTRVAYNPATKMVEVDLRGDISLAPDHAQGLSPRQVAGRVEKAAGEEFSLAVKYCLQQEVNPEQVGPKDIEQFYKRVVSPLYTIYKKKVLQRETRLQKKDSQGFGDNTSTWELLGDL